MNDPNNTERPQNTSPSDEAARGTAAALVAEAKGDPEASSSELSPAQQLIASALEDK